MLFVKKAWQAGTTSACCRSLEPCTISPQLITFNTSNMHLPVLSTTNIDAQNVWTISLTSSPRYAYGSSVRYVLWSTLRSDEYLHHNYYRVFFTPHLHDQLKYAAPIASIGSYKFSFHPCWIRLFNQLPSTTDFAALPAAFQAAASPDVVGLKSVIGKLPPGAVMNQYLFLSTFSLFYHHVLLSYVSFTAFVPSVFIEGQLRPLALERK